VEKNSADRLCSEKTAALAQMAFNEKRGVPRHHEEHAAWELLSPDLRCFY
jgi:hypothetical protein